LDDTGRQVVLRLLFGLVLQEKLNGARIAVERFCQERPNHRFAPTRLFALSIDRMADGRIEFSLQI